MPRSVIAVLLAWGLLFILAVELRTPVFFRLLPITGVVVVAYLVYYTVRAFWTPKHNAGENSTAGSADGKKSKKKRKD